MMRAELAVAAAVVLGLNAGAQRRPAWPVLLGQRRRGLDRCDHAEDRLTGRGRVLLVSQELLMARAVDDPVRAVGRHGGKAHMAGDQVCVASGASGEHHQRLGAEVGERSCFGRGGAGLGELVDEAAQVAAGGEVGACFVF
jgi:hypothetical protein